MGRMYERVDFGVERRGNSCHRRNFVELVESVELVKSVESVKLVESVKSVESVNGNCIGFYKLP